MSQDVVQAEEGHAPEFEFSSLREAEAAEFGGWTGERPEPGSELRAFAVTLAPAVLQVIAAVVEAYRAGEADRAEEAFRSEVVARLQQIQAELQRLQQRLEELGVRILHKIGEVPVHVAAADLTGWLGAVQTAYPSYRNDRRRAVEHFDQLNAATRAAAAYGPALLPLIGTSFATLVTLLHVSGQLRGPRGGEILAAFKQVYATALGPMADPAVPGSLPHQQASLGDLLARADANLSHMKLGRHRMGTHHHGRTDVFVTVTGDPDSGFAFKRSDVHNGPPERPDRPDRHPRWHGMSMLSGLELRAAAPAPADEDLLYYTTGVRVLPDPKGVYSRFGGDRHGDIYDGWISELARTSALNIRIRRAVHARLGGLDDSEHLLEALLRYCS
jgi:hypothetical protein